MSDVRLSFTTNPIFAMRLILIAMSKDVSVADLIHGWCVACANIHEKAGRRPLGDAIGAPSAALGVGQPIDSRAITKTETCRANPRRNDPPRPVKRNARKPKPLWPRSSRRN